MPHSAMTFIDFGLLRSPYCKNAKYLTCWTALTSHRFGDVTCVNTANLGKDFYQTFTNAFFIFPTILTFLTFFLHFYLNVYYIYGHQVSGDAKLGPRGPRLHTFRLGLPSGLRLGSTNSKRTYFPSARKESWIRQMFWVPVAFSIHRKSGVATGRSRRYIVAI